jgi:hypothetical protein
MSSGSEDDGTSEDMSADGVVSEGTSEERSSSTAEDSPWENSPSPCEGLSRPMPEGIQTASRDATSAPTSAGRTLIAAETAKKIARYVPCT